MEESGRQASTWQDRSDPTFTETWQLMRQRTSPGAEWMSRDRGSEQ